MPAKRYRVNLTQDECEQLLGIAPAWQIVGP